MNTPTPETDAAFKKELNLQLSSFIDLARKLERERDKARSLYEQSEAARLTQTTGKVIEWEQCEQERNQLRKVCDELAKSYDALKAWSDALKSWLNGGMIDNNLKTRVAELAVKCEQLCNVSSTNYNNLPHVKRKK